MTLEETNPPSAETLIQHGRDEVIGRLEELAKAEASNGDGRAMRLFRRLMDASGYGKGGKE